MANRYELQDRTRWPEERLASVTEDFNAIDGRHQATKTALKNLIDLMQKGIVRKGIGAGMVRIGKWDADEALYWAKRALEDA